MKPKLSNRALHVLRSPIRKLSPLADQAKASGKHVYHLNIGQPDIETPALALAQLRDRKDSIIPYSASNGNKSYREKLLGYYKSFGVDLNANDILVCNGASEGLWLTMLTIADAGDAILAPEPMYANYLGFAQMAQLEVNTISCNIEDGFCLPSPEAFEQALTEHTKAILICNPNNPTGALYDEAVLLSLGRLCKKHGLYLICDEVYREFTYDGTSFKSILSWPELADVAVVIDSISKRYSACGARVGAVVSANRELMEHLLHYAELRLSPPWFGQWLAEAALDTPPSYLLSVKAEYESRRNKLFSRLQAIPGVVCTSPQGAFYIMAALPVADAEQFCAWLLRDFSYLGRTVMMAPGAGFYKNSALGRQQIRIAYVLNEADIDAAMDCLSAALEVYPFKEAVQLKSSYFVK